MFWDLKTGDVSQNFNNQNPFRGITLVRTSKAYVEVCLLDEFKIIEGEPLVGFILKHNGQYDNDGVALASPLTYDEDRQVYKGFINLITTSINADLNVDGGSTNDLQSIQYMGAFGLFDGEAWISSRQFPVTVENNVFRGNEPTPVPAPEDSSFKIYSALIGGVDSIDSIPTEARESLVAFAVYQNVFSVWKLQEGTEAENVESGIIRPDDYSETNQKIWVQSI